MRKYDHSKIEKKWQKAWSKAKLYETPDSVEGKKNFYLLVEFPYPSGNLHVGHWYAFAVPDILARHLRMKGKNVLYPIGFDAFGLPAENAAIKNKINPRKWTEENIAYMKKQIASMGASFDHSRELATIDPEYYKWTQWMFLQLFKANLAYRKETAVNWCPKDKTVLANEQVINGRCERCDSLVEQKMMLQWNLKITDYADRLIDDLEPLNWPEEIKESQRNWIGRSEGAEIDFPLVFDDDKKYKYVILHGFKSRPDKPKWLWLKRELESMGHEVVIPALPNPDEPSEDEQVAAALAAVSYDENTVLLGSSLGCVVAMKVVQKLEKPIARLVLSGGFADRNFKDKPRNFDKRFSWKFDGDKIRRNAKTIQILHDPLDYAVSEAQLARLEQLLGVKAQLCRTNGPHFTGDTEPDILLWLRPTIRVFTTRVDTLFGATYLVLAPEHPWVKAALGHKTVLKNNDEIQHYVAQASKKTELQRQETKEKTGVELKGVKAINPATGEMIPLWVADYVLGHYGTGAIMAVPAHDERDFEFARKFDLPSREVIEPLYITRGGVDEVRNGMLLEKREAVICIVRNPKDDTYLILKWKNLPWVTFVTGGIENEEPADAGLREIVEESGYKNVRFVRALGRPVHTHFYHVKKKINRWARCQGLYFELIDDVHSPIAPEEAAIHDIRWVTAGEVEKQLTVADMRAVWDRLKKQPHAYTGNGYLCNSGAFDGMIAPEANAQMVDRFGRKKITYRLRDWIVSRQRYWGVPIPIIHCEHCGAVPVPDDQLPVLLPDVKDYLPAGDGKSPLAKVKAFVEAKCPQCGGVGEREIDTFDTFVDSSWYYLAYCAPEILSRSPASSSFQHPAIQSWMPVDLYSGGAEHTTMHLLYSRFWHKALFDLELVADSEPYTRRMNRSIIIGPDGQKMSKSRGNVVDPDEVVKRLGADTVRMYLAFIGPYNEVGSYPWNPDGVVGVRRFLERVWRAQEYVRNENNDALDAVLHRTIRKVGEDIEVLKFNTAIAQLMIMLNELEKEKKIGASQWQSFLKLLAPFAPHLSEELWDETGQPSSIHLQVWPQFDPSKLKDTVLKIGVQVNGKTRAEIEVPAESDRAAIEEKAREAAAKRILGKKIGRTIVVPGRLVNFVLED